MPLSNTESLIKGQEDLFSSGHITSNSDTLYLSRGKRIYFPLAMYLQILKYPRIRGYDPLHMVSLIPIKEYPRIRILQTKTRPNHFLMLLTIFLKILEKIAFAFITSHKTNYSFQVDQSVRKLSSTKLNTA